MGILFIHYKLLGIIFVRYKIQNIIFSLCRQLGIIFRKLQNIGHLTFTAFFKCSCNYGTYLLLTRVKTTGLAGGLLTPYKGLLLAKPKGLLKKIPLLQYMLRYPTGTIFLWYLYFFGFHFLSPYAIIYLLTWAKLLCSRCGWRTNTFELLEFFAVS